MSENKTKAPVPGISVLMMTFNEEQILRKSLASVAWSDDIVVLDSCSTDRTREIASAFPAVRIYERQFDDYSSQRNYGLHSISYLHTWVFLMDADEVCPPELGREMADRTRNPDPGSAAFIVRRKDFFEGKWMRCHYPVWLERLVRPDRVMFHGEVHEQLTYTGSCGRLQNPLHHFPLDKGIDSWIARHNLYSTAMAGMELDAAPAWSWGGLFSRDPLRRRKAYKTAFLRLPGRWLVFFIHRYFIKGGILDGISGLHFVILETFYHFSAAAKAREERRKRSHADERRIQAPA